MEILPDDRRFAPRDPAVVQALGVFDDVLVVFQQQLGWQLRQVEQLRRQGVVEMMDIVLVHPFQLLIAQVLRKLFEPLDVKKREHPLVQSQLVDERNLRFSVSSCLSLL